MGCLVVIKLGAGVDRAEHTHEKQPVGAVIRSSYGRADFQIETWST
jgi:hypothetical protein